MTGLLNNFAAESGPHISIAAEKLFQLGPFAISNSHLHGWISGIIISVILISAARKVGLKARGGVVQFVEMGAQFIVGILESNLGNRKKAYKYAPIFTTIFFFVLLNNWLGLMPGVGPAIEINGVPAFRPFTADLNGTIALAISGVVLVQMIAIKETGGLNHLKHYFGGNFTNPINIFVGILEMFGELTRVFSLALRLFFNVLIGEILISIFTFLGKVGSPIITLPFIAMEIFVGLVQAYIFTMLCATYLGIATSHGEHHDDHMTPHDSHEHGAGLSDKLAKRVEDIGGAWVQ